MQIFKYYGNKIHKDGLLWGGVNWEIERSVREFCEETKTFGKEEFKQLFDIVNNAVQSRFFIDDRDFGWTFGDVDDMWDKSCPLKGYRYIRYSKEFCVRFGRTAIASFYFTPVEESMWRRDEEDMDESRKPRGRMLKESDEEDDIVIFTSMDRKKWKIPRENLENAKWTYDVDEMDGEMEQLFTTKVKDINNKDIFVGVDILVDEDDIHYYGDFIINSKYVAGCTLDGYEVETEEACDDFGIEPKSYNVLKKIYSRRNNLG